MRDKCAVRRSHATHRVGVGRRDRPGGCRHAGDGTRAGGEGVVRLDGDRREVERQTPRCAGPRRVPACRFGVEVDPSRAACGGRRRTAGARAAPARIGGALEQDSGVGARIEGSRACGLDPRLIHAQGAPIRRGRLRDALIAVRAAAGLIDPPGVGAHPNGSLPARRAAALRCHGGRARPACRDGSGDLP
jgi:hypothetical protein